MRDDKPSDGLQPHVEENASHSISLRRGPPLHNPDAPEKSCSLRLIPPASHNDSRYNHRQQVIFRTVDIKRNSSRKKRHNHSNKSRRIFGKSSRKARRNNRNNSAKPLIRKHSSPGYCRTGLYPLFRRSNDVR